MQGTGKYLFNGSHNYLRRSLASGDLFLNFKSDIWMYSILQPFI